MTSPEITPNITIIDTGMGNKRSIQTAIGRAGADVAISADPRDISSSDGLILPGVGAFPEAMRRIREGGLLEPINRFKELGKPILGICLGMQLMFTRSFEQGETEGLGFIPGEVKKLEPTGRKIPVIGWANVAQRRESPLFAEIDDGSMFYHMHSCACIPENEACIVTTSNVVGEYVSAVQSDNLYGVQFHPENSGRYPGIVACGNFVKICQDQI